MLHCCGFLPVEILHKQSLDEICVQCACFRISNKGLLCKIGIIDTLAA